MENYSMHLGNGVDAKHEDLATHCQILGYSGSGKSSIFKVMIAADIEHNAAHGWPAVFLWDSAGDVAEHGLAVAGKHRATRDRVRIVDLSQREHFAGMSLLDGFESLDTDAKAGQVIECIAHVFRQSDEQVLVQYERWMKLVLVPIISAGLTIRECRRFVQDQSFRDALLSKLRTDGKIGDDLVGEWEGFNRLNTRERDNYIAPILNRVMHFLSLAVDAGAECIFGQEHSSINFRESMDQGLIVVFILPDSSAYDSRMVDLVGCLALSKLIYGAYSRADTPEHERTPVRCYVDEFHRFAASKIMCRALAEMRKYKLSFVLAHQYLNQLQEYSEQLYHGVLTNCATKICFGLSAEDAEVMAKHMFSFFLQADIVKDEIYQQVITPVESTRTAHHESTSEGVLESKQRSRTEGWSEAETESDGISAQQAEGEADAVSYSEGEGKADGVSKMDAKTSMDSWGSSAGGGSFSGFGGASHSSSGTGLSYLGDMGGFALTDDPIGTNITDNSGTTSNFSSGNSDIWSDMSGGGSAESHAAGTSHVNSQSRAFAIQRALSKSRGRSISYAIGLTRGKSESVSEGESVGKSSGKMVGFSIVPFYEQHIHRELSNRQFYSVPDKMAKVVHALISLKPRHAYIQRGHGKMPCSFGVLDVEAPRINWAARDLLLYMAYEVYESGKLRSVIEEEFQRRLVEINAMIEENENKDDDENHSSKNGSTKRKPIKVPVLPLKNQSKNK